MNAEDIVNMFALTKLEMLVVVFHIYIIKPSIIIFNIIFFFLSSYGFHKNHCAEALQFNQGDVGLALELLLVYLMKMNWVEQRCPNFLS